MQSYSETIDHFSHSHPLNLVDTAYGSHSRKCAACKTQVSGWTYRCSRGCNFFIHARCGLLPVAITHPAHADSRHHLALLATPPHPGGQFKCDGCGHHGDGFSYRCTRAGCDFDLHADCASRPMSVTHSSHGHQLSLVFSPPYANRAFSCDLCRTAGSGHWLYRCESCNFDAHLGCVAAATDSPLPSPSQPQPQPIFLVPGTTGAYPTYVLGQQGTGVGGINSNQPLTAASFGVGLMAVGAQGVAEGVGQQAGQSIVQNMTGGGGGGDTNWDIGDIVTGFDLS